MQEKEIESKFKKLPEHLKEEVLKYVDYLLLQQQDGKYKQSKPFTFKWEGTLKDENINVTSVELQHKSLEWR